MTIERSSEVDSFNFKNFNDLDIAKLTLGIVSGEHTFSCNNLSRISQAKIDGCSRL